MESLGLGQIITTPQERDAIHVAVAPVVAAEHIGRGSRLVFIEGSKEQVKSVRTGGIGIADPFLDQYSIEQGQRFWMFLFPGTITSLRHEWTHPAFEPPPPPSADPVADSRRWIEKFAADIDQTYHRVMKAAESWVKYGEYTYDNTEAYKDHWDKFPAFWQHYEIVTGKEVDDKEASFFTCSC